MPSQSAPFAQLLDDMHANNPAAPTPNSLPQEDVAQIDAESRGLLEPSQPAENARAQGQEPGKHQPPGGSMLPHAVLPAISTHDTAAEADVSPQPLEHLPPPQTPATLPPAATPAVVPLQPSATPKTVTKPQALPTAELHDGNQHTVQTSQADRSGTKPVMHQPAAEVDVNAAPSTPQASKPLPAVPGPAVEPLVKQTQPNADPLIQQPAKELTTRSAQMQVQAQHPMQAQSQIQSQSSGQQATDSMNAPAIKGEAQNTPTLPQPAAPGQGTPVTVNQSTEAKQQTEQPVSGARPTEQAPNVIQTAYSQAVPGRAPLEASQPLPAPSLDDLQRNPVAQEPRRNSEPVTLTSPVEARGTVGVARAVADMRQALQSNIARQTRTSTMPAAETGVQPEPKISADWIERAVPAPNKAESLHSSAMRPGVAELGPISQTAAPRGQVDAVYDQVMRVMTRQALQQGKLTLQLTPRELGSVDIEFSTERGELQVAIVAREQSTRDLLDQTLPRLRQSLQDAGINLGDVEVRQDHNRQQHAGKEGGRATNPERLPDNPTPHEHTNPHPATAEGRLNIYV